MLRVVIEALKQTIERRNRFPFRQKSERLERNPEQRESPLEDREVRKADGFPRPGLHSQLPEISRIARLIETPKDLGHDQFGIRQLGAAAMLIHSLGGVHPALPLSFPLFSCFFNCSIVFASVTLNAAVITISSISVLLASCKAAPMDIPATTTIRFYAASIRMWVISKEPPVAGL